MHTNRLQPSKFRSAIRHIQQIRSLRGLLNDLEGLVEGAVYQTEMFYESVSSRAYGKPIQCSFLDDTWRTIRVYLISANAFRERTFFDSKKTESNFSEIDALWKRALELQKTDGTIIEIVRGSVNNLLREVEEIDKFASFLTQSSIKSVLNLLFIEGDS